MNGLNKIRSLLNGYHLNFNVMKEACCVVQCGNPLDQKYWDQQWKSGSTGWDLGKVSPPISEYIDQLKDKNLAILIPGCGNAYEAEYLLEKGFTNVTLIDISPTAVDILKQKFLNHKHIRILCEDFFDHKNQYDLILEQTFFCALPPEHRPEYVKKIHDLLKPEGKLVGLLFDREFDFEGPPFGGFKHQYEDLFKEYFELNTFEKATNSFPARNGTELFINFKKFPDCSLNH